MITSIINKKIFIDPGHGGKDSGAVDGNLIEKNMNLITAKALQEKLEQNGLQVKMSRTTDTYLSLTERCNLANNWGADYFISCHYNAGGGDRGEVIHSVNVGEGQGIALKISDAMKVIGQSIIKTYSRASTSGNGVYYTVISATNMPAVIVEGCFIDNAIDRQIADTEEEQKAMGYAIANGVLNYIGVQNVVENVKVESEEINVAQTVMKLDNIWVQEIEPSIFEIMQCDCTKRDISIPNYFNLGFFASLGDGSTIPVGNLANNGEIISQAKDNADWINVAKKELTTIYTTNNGQAGIIKTNDLTTITDLKTAVSGIPIIVGGKYVDIDTIKSEGYFGSELYDTWHGFLGLRHGKLVYVATKCDYGAMCWVLVALGIYDAISLDGGGSFILHNGKEFEGTSENRRINNIGIWE